MNCQVTMDQHIAAYDWLDKMGVRLLDLDVDDVMAVVEQVVVEQDLTK